MTIFIQDYFFDGKRKAKRHRHRTFDGTHILVTTFFSKSASLLMGDKYTIERRALELNIESAAPSRQ